MNTKEYYELILRGIPSDKMKNIDSYKKELVEEYHKLCDEEQNILKGKYHDAEEYLVDLHNEMIILDSTIRAIEYFQS